MEKVTDFVAAAIVSENFIEELAYMFSKKVPIKLPYQENGWKIFITEGLKKLNLINHDKIWVDKKVDEKIELPSKTAQNFSSFFLMQPEQNKSKFVGWNQFKIQKVESDTDVEKLLTEHLSSCYALAVQIYHEGKLSHLGLAHCAGNPEIPGQFFQKIAEVTENKYDYINLFICGGSSLTSVSDKMGKAIQEASQSIRDVRLVHDVSKALYKNVMVVHEDTVYSGSIGIKEVGFDDNCHPRICVDVQVEGVDLKNVLASTSEKGVQCGFW